LKKIEAAENELRLKN